MQTCCAFSSSVIRPTRSWTRRSSGWLASRHSGAFPAAESSAVAVAAYPMSRSDAIAARPSAEAMLLWSRAVFAMSGFTVRHIVSFPARGQSERCPAKPEVEAGKPQGQSFNFPLFFANLKPYFRFAKNVQPRRCGEMADAQDLKSWDLKKSCGFESRHRHQSHIYPIK